MKKLLLLLLCVPLIGVGQGWVYRTYYAGHEVAYSVQQTTDGGYIIAGRAHSLSSTLNSDPDVYLVKLDGQGGYEWEKYVTDGVGRDVKQTTDGGYIITGWEGYIGAPEACLIKTDANGNTLWAKNFVGPFPPLLGDGGNSVQQTTDGGYVICGGNGLIKTDGSGDTLWSKTFVGAGKGHSVQQTTDGGYVVVNGNSLIKTDGNGSEQWSKTFGAGVWSDVIRDVKQTTDGGYIITGQLSSSLGLIKTDGSGDTLWSKTFGWDTNSPAAIGYSVQQTTDGGYIVCGQKVNSYLATSNTDTTAIYLIKTDGSGVEQWSKVMEAGGVGNCGYSVQQTTDGGFVITGSYQDYSYVHHVEHNIIVIKTNSNGSITSQFTIPINPNRELKKVVDILGRDVKPEKNKPFIEIYNDGTVEKKIIID